MTNRLIQPPPRDLPTPANGAERATDGELLMRFSRHGDSAALAEVVERHRAMIWGVCTRVLVRRADAEDAYQATLLILAKKAASVRANDSAAGWLFRVAQNTSLAALRRRKALRETPLEEQTLPPEAPYPDLERKQLGVALLEELRALPTKYQTPLVLRYLEGHSRREIAAAMDATVATVAGRLVRGRRMLRSRLARRGVSLAVALGAVGIGSSSQAASVATIHGGPPLFDPTTTLSTTASAAVQQLVTQGVRSMFYASLTKPAAAGVAAVFVAAVLLVESDSGAAESTNEPGLRLEVAAASTNDDREDKAGLLLAQNKSIRADTQAKPATLDGNVSPAAPAGFVASPGGPKPDKVDAFFVPARADSAGLTQAFDAQRKRYAEMAAKESSIDLSQPSFEELYWHRNHWLNKQDALVASMQSLQDRKMRKAQLVANGTASQSELVGLDDKLLDTRADLPLVKAKIAEYERLMKQAALRETQPVRNADSPRQTLQDAILQSWIDYNWAGVRDPRSDSSPKSLPSDVGTALETAQAKINALEEELAAQRAMAGQVQAPLLQSRTSEVAAGALLQPGDTLLFEYHSTESPTPSFRRLTVDSNGVLDLGSGFDEKFKAAGEPLAEVRKAIRKLFTGRIPGFDFQLGASYRGSVRPGLAERSAEPIQRPPLPRPVEPISGSIQTGETLRIEIIDLIGETGLFTVPGDFGGKATASIQTFRVDTEGQVALGALLGRVKVAGKTATEAEEAIQTAVTKRIDLLEAKQAARAERSGGESPRQRGVDLVVQVTRVEGVTMPPLPKPLPNQGFGIESSPQRR